MKSKGVLILLISSLAYSGFVITNKRVLESGFSAFQFTFLMIAGLTLISLFFIAKDFRLLKQMTVREWVFVGLIGVLASGFVQFLFVYGQKFTSALNAGFISTLSAPFTAILAVFLLNEELSLKRWVLASTSFLGIILLTTNLDVKGFSLGDGLILIAMALVAFTNVLAKLVMRRLNGLFVNALRHVFGFLFVFLTALILGRLWAFSAVPAHLWPLLLASIGLTFIFLAFFYWGIQLTSPTIATVIGLSEILFTSLFAILFLGESLSSLQWAGGLVAAGAIAWFALAN